jgi:hypothetical protein
VTGSASIDNRLSAVLLSFFVNQRSAVPGNPIDLRRFSAGAALIRVVLTVRRPPRTVTGFVLLKRSAG